MKALYLISVWLHILAAMLWLGGMLYLVFVLVPVLRRKRYGGIAGRFLHEMGVQFRNLGWICFALLFASGTFNLTYPAAMRQHPTAPETERLRRQAGMFGRLNLLLGLLVVFVAVMMVRGWF